MKTTNNISKIKGTYYGTEIDEKWWKRYSKNKFLARGSGEYWYDREFFYFQRLLTKTPITIPLKAIVEFKVGTWHAGNWGAKGKILKLVWHYENRKLSSGFKIAGGDIEIKRLIVLLKSESEFQGAHTQTEKYPE